MRCDSSDQYRYAAATPKIDIGKFPSMKSHPGEKTPDHSTQSLLQ
jgi:hypothetical protein